MSLNKEQIIKTLNENSRRVSVGIDQYDAVTEVDYDYVAGQILSVVQSNSDPQPPLPQAGVLRLRELLAQKLKFAVKDKRRNKQPLLYERLSCKI